MRATTPSTDFDHIFHPRNIAIIGVSKEGIGFGAGIFNSLRAIGFGGGIFLVNPKGGTLNGEVIYPHIEDIPERFDLAIIAVAARAVPAALEACRLKGAAGAEIFSSGFKE
ncbi:MAG: CoA-binding protein, partial [Desulfatitalea sp.]